MMSSPAIHFLTLRLTLIFFQLSVIHLHIVSNQLIQLYAIISQYELWNASNPINAILKYSTPKDKKGKLKEKEWLASGKLQW